LAALHFKRQELNAAMVEEEVNVAMVEEEGED